MKPNKEEFIEKIAPQLGSEDVVEAKQLLSQQLLSEAIYTVLFDAHLSQLTERQI
jgi:hypothetical protein